MASDSQNLVYHISPNGNIKEFTPRAGTYETPYVFAAKSVAFASLFACHGNGDFDGMYNIDSNGVVHFKEAYPGAFEERFSGKPKNLIDRIFHKRQKCYLYTLDASKFTEGKTSERGEVVSESSVKPISCQEIKDIPGFMQSLINEGSLVVERYNENDKESQKEINDHVKSRIEMFGLLDNPKRKKALKFCKKKFPNIVKEIIDDKKNPKKANEDQEQEEITDENQENSNEEAIDIEKLLNEEPKEIQISTLEKLKKILNSGIYNGKDLTPEQKERLSKFLENVSEKGSEENHEKPKTSKQTEKSEQNNSEQNDNENHMGMGDE